MAHSFENVCKIIPGASKGLKKCLAGAVYEQEKDETETNSVPGDLKKNLNRNKSSNRQSLTRQVFNFYSF